MMTATSNLSQCLPEIATALAAGPVIRTANGNLDVVMLMGAAAAICGAAVVWRVPVPSNAEPEGGAARAGKGAHVEMGHRGGGRGWLRLGEATGV